MLSKQQQQLWRGLRSMLSHSLYKQPILHSGPVFFISTSPKSNFQRKIGDAEPKKQPQQRNIIQNALSKASSRYPITRQDFDEIYLTIFKINLNELSFDDLCTFIIFYGLTTYRNVEAQKCFRAATTLLNEVKKRSPLQEAINNPAQLWNSHSVFFSNQWPELIIAASNVNILDTQLYEKFLEYAKFKSGENLRKFPITVKKLLSLITAFRRVGFEDPEFETIMLEEIYAQKSEIIHDGMLRMAWIVSFDIKNTMSPERYNEIKTFFIRGFFGNVAKQTMFSYNLKNCFHICQTILNIFPEIAIHTVTNIDSQDSGNNINEDLLRKAIKGSRYEDLFEICYHHYKVALWIISTGYGPQKINMSQPSYVSRGGNGINLYVYKPTFNPKISHAEGIILKVLESIPGLKVHRLKQIGPYEVDFFIEPDIVLEKNGSHHFIISGNTRRLTPNYYQKMK